MLASSGPVMTAHPPTLAPLGRRRLSPLSLPRLWLPSCSWLNAHLSVAFNSGTDLKGVTRSPNPAKLCCDRPVATAWGEVCGGAQRGRTMRVGWAEGVAPCCAPPLPCPAPAVLLPYVLRPLPCSAPCLAPAHPQVLSLTQAQTALCLPLCPSFL